MNEKNIVRFITIAPFIFISSIVITIFLISFSHNQEVFQTAQENLQNEFIQKQRNSTVSKVKMAIELVGYERSTIKNRLQSKVKDRAMQAFLIGHGIYKRYSGKKSEAEIQEMIIAALRSMTWNNGESFIFIATKSGTLILGHEYMRYLEGKNLLKLPSAESRDVIKHEIEIATKKGEGFLSNKFTRPGREISKRYEQLSFIKDFEIFDWYIGSAEYLDTTIQEIDRSTLAILRNINKNSSGYFFIFDDSGKIILHSYKPELEGKNFFDIDDRLTRSVGEKFSKNMRLFGEDFISYSWENPKTKEIETKYSFIQKIPESDWMIGSGFYVRQLEEAQQKKQEELKRINGEKLELMLVYLLIIGAFSMLVAFFISNRLRKKFGDLKKSLAIKSMELKKLNTDLEYKIDERTHELQQAYEKMQLIANTDSLTQIHNRYSFLNAFNNELQKYKTSQTSFSLIMFDIDNFKDINDTFGHDTGDTVIVTITDIVKRCLRNSDIFGRIGGEEFMILLPYTAIDSAEEIARRIRNNINAHEFKDVVKVTVSSGVVEYIDDESADEMLKRVDIALYMAKDGGRDKVVILKS